jgi:cell division protein FtsW (lipid II flippase)
MPDRRKIEFIPETHTDFIFRIEPENRGTRLLTWLLRPLAVLLMRVWFGVKDRRF